MFSTAEATRTNLEAEMARPDVYENPERMRVVKTRHDDVTIRLEQLMQRWDELAELADGGPA
jgi:hypothetical protein